MLSSRSVSSSSRSSSSGSSAIVSFWMCDTWRSTISSTPRLKASKSCSAKRACGGRARQRQDLGRRLADGVVFLLQQAGDVAVAGVAHAREQLALLEVEMRADVVLDQARERAGERGELRVRAPRVRERRAMACSSAAEHIECVAVLGVERLADLAHEAHGEQS